MKKMFNYLATMAMCVALTGLMACNDDPEPTPEPEPNPYTESNTYAINYNNSAIAAGTTLEYHPTSSQIEMDFATIELIPVNKTDGNLATVLKVEKIEGPETMDDIMICYGETCKNPHCPWVSDPFTLVPGENNQMLIKFDYTPSMVTSKTTYRMTMGKGATLDDPQVILINVNAQ